MTTLAASNTLIEWTDELSIGIDEIDDQHKELVVLLNRLHVAITERHGNEVAAEILDELIDYTRIHFAVEESIMRLLDYPDFVEHKKHHEELIAQVMQMKAKVQTGQARIGFELLHFLKKWLTGHIMEEDKLYVPHFVSKGVSRKHSSKLGKFVGWLRK